MCRCVNGKCSGEECPCFRDRGYCLDCWCVLCNNREPEQSLPSINPQQLSRVSEEHDESVLSLSTSVLSISSQTYQSRGPTVNKRHHCNCKASMCRNRQCGCRKRDQYCGRGCGCPASCQNQSSQSNSAPQASSNFFPNFISLQAPSPAPVQPLPMQVSPNMGTPPRQIQYTFTQNTSYQNQTLNIHDISVIPATKKKPSQVQQNIPSPKVEQEPNLNQLPRVLLGPESASGPRPIRCCSCLSCAEGCPCLSSGECCLACLPTCWNLDLQLGDLEIPNFVKL